jgi:Methyltransferase domain
MRLREAIDILRSLGTLPSLVSGLSRELERMREQQEKALALCQVAVDEMKTLQTDFTEKLTTSLQMIVEQNNKLPHAITEAVVPNVARLTSPLGIHDPRQPANLFVKRCHVAQEDTLQIFQNSMSDAMCILDHAEFLRDAVRRAPVEGNILELGVFSGTTIRWMAEANPDRNFVGFDSFYGLPGDWTGYLKFDFNRRGEPPEVPDNVHLIIGDFAKTVPEFVRQYPKLAMVHIDCDIYESARTVLDKLRPLLCPGVILVFDEYFNYSRYCGHEFGACAEFLAETGLGIRWLTFSGERAAGQLV